MSYNFSTYHLLQALGRFENQYLPLDLFLRHYFKAHHQLGAKDRRTISDAIYGMFRWKLLLDHLIGPTTTWEKRYHIYQQFQPTNYLSVNAIPLHIRLSFPKDFFDLLLHAYGEQRAIYLATVLNTAAPTTIRINPAKTTREEMLESFSKEHKVYPCKMAPYGITFEKRSALYATSAYKQGLFEVQDEASQLVCELIECSGTEQILDYCAGAGGKTLGFAHKTKGRIYLHDIRPQALLQAKKRLQRAGVENVHFLQPLMGQLKEKMDVVLVDVPCSGSGTLRRHPEQKWKFCLENLQKQIKEQRDIFSQALGYLKPGGKIIYATCSIFKEENENQIAYFLQKHPVTMTKAPFCSHPSMGGMDGFFAATLKKNERP